MSKSKKSVPQTTVTRDLEEFSKPTGNLYESVVVMSKRSNQIAASVKQDLETKLQEFATFSEGADEVQNNEEQIELSKFYEKLPKPVLVAAKEFEDGDLVFTDPMKALDDEASDDSEDLGENL